MSAAAETATHADADFTREGRYLDLRTPLGADALLATALTGCEAISEPFRFDVEFLSSRHDIAPERLVGSDVSIRVMPAGPRQRFLHGRMSRLSAGPLAFRGFRAYRAEVVPWLWFLSQSLDCRIFQEKSVPDIVERVFADHGFSAYEMNVQRGDYPKRDYCVQYRETALDFVSRLLEEEGIFYFFRHAEDGHTMVLADSNVAFKDLPAPDDKPQFSANPQHPGDVGSWEQAWGFRTGRWTQRDFDFEKPSTSLEVDQKTLLKFPNAEAFERYDYPGGYLDNDRGGRLTRLRMEADEAAHHVVRGTGTNARFCAGGRFALANHPVRGGADEPHVLRRVWHEARDPTWFNTGEVASYANRFECFPKDLTFRPERATPRPTVRGPQTATVTGPAGEEIFTDRHGRVKLRFHWDRNPDGNPDERSSCWVRASQAWAGAGFGTIAIPRVGQEVVVDFLEGDPDRPIVTGRVYNAERMPPHGLPGAAVKSGIKSNSTKGGGGSNELTFDDTKGKEKVYFHAQYDHEAVVEHDETCTVHNNRTATVDVDETLTVHANRTRKVDGKEGVTVDGDRTRSVGGNETYDVGGNRKYDVGGNETLGVSGNQTLTVMGTQEVGVTGPAKLQTDANREVSVAVAYRLQATTVEVNATAAITLSVGGSSVKIDPSGVTVVGPLVKLN